MLEQLISLVQRERAMDRTIHEATVELKQENTAAHVLWITSSGVPDGEQFIDEGERYLQSGQNNAALG